MSVHANRFSADDRSAIARCLAEVLAMETVDTVPAHHHDAHQRAAAGAIGCALHDLRPIERDEIAALAGQLAATRPGELTAVLEPDAGLIVVIERVTDLAAMTHALEDLAASGHGPVVAALYRHPAGGRFAPNLR